MSSLKFSFPTLHGADIGLVARGQVEGLTTRAKFTARGADGAVVGARTWNEGGQLGA